MQGILDIANDRLSNLTQLKKGLILKLEIKIVNRGRLKTIAFKCYHQNRLIMILGFTVGC